ncbi:MAG: type ISP restriction/modification enzyme [Candidatus Nanopelagicales bacterium]
MASVDEVVAAIRAVPGAHRDRGTLFEQLTAEYLRRDPVFAQRFSQVWLWSDWPGRGTATDTGIDLVAEEADGSGLCAVQCKLYDADHQVSKADVDTFFTASGKRGFTSRLIVSTTDKWGKNAEEALTDQTISVSRIGLADMAASPIEWDTAWIGLGHSPSLNVHAPHSPRPHQRRAVDDVFTGWGSHDRGQLIMACGTGKTFTALKIAERLVAEHGGSTVLFLVPSIALLSQSLREWTAESTTPMHAQAVCSDPKSTAEARRLEDVSTHDLPLAASTDPQHLLDGLSGATAPLRVVFSTYQSIDQVAAAVQLSRAAGGGVLDSFDLIVCDEAHRTTGVTLAGADESHFQKVHDNTFLPAARRLYMTATPKIFADTTKKEAQENNAVLASMDNPEIFGPEFHRLGFGKAVEQGLLADYRVLILTVDEQFVANGWQQMLANDAELTLDDAARIVGCWNGLAKRSKTFTDPVTGQMIGFPPNAAPMRRAVAFSQTIKASKALAEKFTDVTASYTGQHAPELRCEVDHVDGTMNSLTRNDKLAWLKADTAPDVCRILSNARCLSEGVDVPSLDAVLFLTPRNSVVDVVQSVGRVMRTAPGKEYGYVVLPVAIPAGTPPEEALRDNKRYKVVWQVLQALRAHDDRFNATINKIELNTKRPDQIMVMPVTDPTDSDGASSTQGVITFPVELLTDAVYSRIVTKVGERTYWEQLAGDVAAIAAAHVARITAVVNDPASGKQAVFQAFLDGLRATINPSIDETAAIDMLAQHLITRPVFEALFADYEFLSSNPVSQTMQTMLEALDDQGLESERATLDTFYESVRLRAEGIDNHAGRQKIMTELYERFFKTALPKTADSLGIVYTPVEVVDFILRSVDRALQRHLGCRLTDEGVQVLDPFTGTGTFITRLLASGLIEPHDLARKYTSELNANEMVLLAYYIAAVNIEATYHDAANAEQYQPFDGLVLTDTFQASEDADTIDDTVFATNTERGLRQLGLDVRVIVGNPPYSAKQTSMNDANQNLKYPTLDTSIEATYAARSTATNKNSLYDSYIRAFRWASDRIGDSGVIGFVSNGGWIDANTTDGMRKTLAEEFDHIYIYNLRGNQRTAGELSRQEGGKIFGAGSRNTVAITLLVKTGETGTEPAPIHYRDIGDYLDREQKLALVDQATLDTLDWQTITPNKDGDWIHKRSDAFAAMMPIGDKTGRGLTVFGTYSRGLATGRDAWLYNFDRQPLASNLERMIAFHNQQVEDYQAHLQQRRADGDNPTPVEQFIDTDPRKISWNRADKADLPRGNTWPPLDWTQIGMHTYRPFTKEHGVLSARLCDMVYQLPRFFPKSTTSNHGFYIVGAGSDKPWSLLMVALVPDVNYWGSGGGQFFPRYTYTEPEDDGQLFAQHEGNVVDGYVQVDNITDAILLQFQASAGEAVTKDGIFHYVYGLLHSPDYRVLYAADLKKMLPRIPIPRDVEMYEAFLNAGEQLAALHLGYESVEPYPLTEEWLRPPEDPAAFRVTKMAHPKIGGKPDLSRVVYNSQLTLAGIPEDAHRYMLGARSAIDWIIDRYQVRTDKASGITNDPNAYSDDPRYVIDLLKRIVTVSLETMQIVDSLPSITSSVRDLQ